MSDTPGRGAQISLTGDAREAARGAAATTLVGNRDAMLAATEHPAGATFEFCIRLPIVDGVTATPAGTHETATPLTAQVSNVTTVATAADAVMLPALTPGELAVVINSSAADLKLFGAGAATINGVATDTGVALVAGKVGVYVAVTADQIFGGALA